MKTIKYLLISLLLFVPSIVMATSINEVIESKELTIKSVPIYDDNSFFLVNEKIAETYEGYGIDNCNEDYTKCSLMKNGEEVAKDIKIVYEYDKDVKTVVDNIMKKVPSEGKKFTLYDIETIKYVLDLMKYKGEEELNPIRYSSEYKSFIDYNNFVFEPRMGYDEDFAFFRGGTASFEYNGVIYGYADGIKVKGNMLLYVKDDETDIEGALKTRLSKYFDVKSVTKDTSITVTELLEEDYNSSVEAYNNCKTEYDEVMNTPNEERDDAWQSRMSDVTSRCYFVSQYPTGTAYADALKESEFDEEDAPFDFYEGIEDYLYVVEFKDGTKLTFAVKKDSKNIFDKDVTVANVDASTGVFISTTSSIPLDTLISVARLTSGEEYEKIVKVLNKTNVELFDLKLFSKSADKYITKLDNGEFLVKLPISEAFKGKDLEVYYVNDNNEIVKYGVVVEGDYATFVTDHFSVYTLAEKETTTEAEIAAPTNVPETGDELFYYVAIFAVCITLVIVSIVVLRRRNK